MLCRASAELALLPGSEDPIRWQLAVLSVVTGLVAPLLPDRTITATTARPPQTCRGTRDLCPRIRAGQGAHRAAMLVVARKEVNLLDLPRFAHAIALARMEETPTLPSSPDKGTVSRWTGAADAARTLRASDQLLKTEASSESRLALTASNSLSVSAPSALRRDFRELLDEFRR